jgi:hypothetical protein
MNLKIHLRLRPPWRNQGAINTKSPPFELNFPKNQGKVKEEKN